MTGPGEGLAVILIEPAGEALRQLQERTNLSRADIANRALVLYQFVDAELRACTSSLRIARRAQRRSSNWSMLWAPA